MVQLSTVEGEHHFGVVRYVGDMPGVAGTWAGVELESEVKGGHGGTVGGRKGKLADKPNTNEVF